MSTTLTKDFQKQLLFLINKIEKIEDLCKEISPESYKNEPYGPYKKPDFYELLEKSKTLTFTDGIKSRRTFSTKNIKDIVFMKYKICKLVDGNGTITYRIKKKGWLFWRWITAASGPLGHDEYLDFFTFEQANNWIKESKKVKEYYKNCRKIKIVECVEIKVSTNGN